MKIYVYETREDESAYFEQIKKRLPVELIQSQEVPSIETAAYAKGCMGVTTLGQGQITSDILDIWHQIGIKYLSVRTIGYNNIDVNYAKKVGIRVCHSNYPPDGVADFTVMLMLMCLRNYKQALWRGQVNDFSLNGLKGRQMKDLTIGIIGTGKIGYTVLKNLTGFGAKLLAYDLYPNEHTAQIAEYVDIDTLYQRCDVISLHTPLFDSTYHMINKKTLHQMKEGVIIINCARGELADNEALIAGIESGKIGALGLDVVEGEEGISHIDHRTNILSNNQMAYLRQFKNVIMTQHMAFYTDKAVESMVHYGVQGIVDMANGACETEI